MYYVLGSLIIASGFLIPLIPIFFSNSWEYNIGPTGYQIRAAISSNGEYIVGTADNDIMLFRRSNPQPIWTYKTVDSFGSVVISSNGDYFAALSSGKVLLFNKDNPNPIWEFDGEISSLSISSNGHYIAAGADGAILLFNIASSTPVWSYPTISGFETIGIYEIAISKDSNFITAGAQNGTIFLFNRTHPIPLWKYSTGLLVRSVAISAIGEYVALGNENQVLLFNRSNANPIWNFSTTSDKFRSLAISDNGNYIVAGSGHKARAYLFSKNSSIPLFTYESSEGSEFDPHHTTVDLSSDGSRIFVEFSIHIGTHIYIFNNHDSIDVSSDGNHFVSIGINSIVYFNIKTPLIFANYIVTYLIIIIPLATIELIFGAIFILYKSIKRNRFQEKEQKRYAQIISEKVIDENKINMVKLKQSLNIDEKIFDKQLLEWILKYNLTIDGDYIIVDKYNLNDLIKALEGQFKKWKKDSEKKF